MGNSDIIKIFREIAEFLEMEKIPFKPRAYEKAAEAIGDSSKELRDLYEAEGKKALLELPGIGTSMAEKIEEYLKTGKIEEHEKLKKKFPINLASFKHVEGLGPQTIVKLYNELGIVDISGLELALREGKLRGLKGFGEKSEEKILKAIGFAKLSEERFHIAEILPLAYHLEELLTKIKGVQRATVAGSIRRRKETVRDIDIVVASSHSADVMDFVLGMSEVVHIHAKGETKVSVKLKIGSDLDVRVVPTESYGAALNYFTGSKNHNIALRNIALERGFTLNEYGLFKRDTLIAGGTEEELYHSLGMDYIEPELRENMGEVELSLKHALPTLIGYDDLLGDLQVHSTWSDGANTIEEMAHAAMERGYSYIAMTDHSKRLAMTNGLTEARLIAQGKEIDKINSTLRARNQKFKVFKGTECDILKDGSLDFSDNALSSLDIVGISVHSYFNLPRDEQTKRITNAMKNKHVDIFFHPTGRMIKKRPGYDVDIDEIIRIAKVTGTMLELDAALDRLDLKDEYIKKCIQKGVKFSIDSDSHATNQFECLSYGIAQARRGGARKEDVINTRSADKIVDTLKNAT